MAIALVEKTLSVTKFSQLVAAKSGAIPVRALDNTGLKLEVYEDSDEPDGPGFRVWVVSTTDAEDDTRLADEWFVGSATVSSVDYDVYAQPLSPSEAEAFKPGAFLGAWVSGDQYSVGDMVSYSGGLYVVKNSLRDNSTDPATDSGTNWTLMLDASSTVADGSITEAKLANNAITSAKILNGTILGEDLADQTITANQLQANSVQTSKIADAAVTTAKLASGAVTGGQLSNGAVTQDKIGSYQVSSIKIDTGAVTVAKIADGNVTTAKLEPSLEAKFLYNGGAQEPLKPWNGQTISGAYFGFPRKPLNTFYNCRFLGRSSELHCTLNGSTLSENQKNAMFNQVWSSVTMANAGDPDAVLNINFTTNGLTSSNGFTYSQGWVLVSFYSAWTPTAMTARTKDKNGVWTTRTVRKEHSQSTSNQTYINSWSVQLGGNYVTDIELTMTPQSSDTGNRVGISNISYFGTRMNLSQGPLVTCLGGEYYGTISGVEQGTTNWSINQDGDADVTSLDVTNNITVGGTVDGRDIAADGSKLDGIDTGATSDENLGNADQTLTASRTIDDGNNGYLFFVDLEDTGKKSQILMNPGNPNILVQANDTGAGNVTALTVGSENLNLQFTGTSDLRINNAAGTAGQVLTSNGTGNAPSWETPGAVIFAAGDVTSQTVTTSYTVVTTNSPSINTAGITFSSSVFTVPAALAGKYISFAMTLDASQTSGDNRVELDLALQKFNGSTWDDITKITNYAQRANSHDSGGVTMAESFDLSGTLSGGEQYRWRVRQAGNPTTVTSVLSSYTIKVYS